MAELDTCLWITASIIIYARGDEETESGILNQTCYAFI